MINVILIFSIWFLIFSFTPALAAGVGSTDDPMTVGGGARAIGLGRAFAAIADDADAPFINPAGIAGLKGPQAMMMYTNLLEDIYYREYCGAVPTPYGTVGIGFISTGVQFETQLDSNTVYTDYYDTLFVLTFSTPLGRYFQYGNNLFVGGNFKLFNRGYTGGINQYASGKSADFGLKLILSPFLSFGISVQNFLPVSLGGVIRLNSGAEESLAGITKVGVAIKPDILNRKLLIAADVDLSSQSGRPVTSHLGVEWKTSEFLSLRAGLDQSVDSATASQTSWNPAYGISFGYGNFRVDYAYHPYYNYPGLATTYVSFSYVGEPWFALKGRVE